MSADAVQAEQETTPVDDPFDADFDFGLDDAAEEDDSGGEEVGDDDEDSVAEEDSDADDQDSGDADDGEIQDDEPAQPAIDHKILMDAARAGLSYDEAVAFGTNDALLTHLRLVERIGKEKADAQAADEKAQDMEWFELPPLEELDEEVRNTLTGMNEAAKQQVVSMRSEIATLREQLIHQQQAAYEERFEAAVNGLEDEWADSLGKGGMDDVSEEQFRNRQKIFAAVDRLARIDQDRGERRNLSKLVSEAVKLEFADKLKQNARKEIVEKTKKRQKVRKPGSAKKHDLDSDTEEDALSFIEEGLRHIRGR